MPRESGVVPPSSLRYGRSYQLGVAARGFLWTSPRAHGKETRPRKMRSVLRLVPMALAWVLSETPTSAQGSPSFSAPQPLVASAFTDAPPPYSPTSAGDQPPSIAAGLPGVWVAVWGSVDTFGAGDNLEFSEVVFSRSTDGGRTWTAGVELSDNAAVNDGGPAIATDGQGVWVVAWSHSGSVQYARSTDDGLTWGPPIGILGPGADGAGIAIASDRAGSWVAAWGAEDPSNDDDIYTIRSNDNGISWTAPVQLSTDAMTDARPDESPDIAGDGLGNWVATWSRDGRPVTARSTDNAVSWSALYALGTGEFSGSARPQIATDRDGTWVVAWSSNLLPGLSFNIDRALFSRSTDAGLTWTSQQQVGGTAQNVGDRDHGPVRVVVTGPSRWSLFWQNVLGSFGGTISSDYADILTSESLDGGQTWGPPALVNLNGRDDGKNIDDTGAAVGTDLDGTTIVAWASNEDLGGTIGSDFDILYAVSRDDCPPTPKTGCLTPTSPRASRLSIRDGKGGRDKLIWGWRKGQETAPGDFGDPTTTSSYVVCLYAKAGGVLTTVFEEDVPAATTCSGKSCWSASGDGFAYMDRKFDQGSMRKLSLVPGADGSARVDMRASGPALAPPSLPLDMSVPVEVQLINLETDTCWSSTFSSASRNDTSRFKASSD